MTSGISLKKLVRKAVSTQVPSKAFNSLLTQLEKREPISNNEYVTSLLELDSSGTLANKDFHQYQQELVLGLAISSSVQSARFWKNLASISPLSQVSYLKKMDGVLTRDRTGTDFEVPVEIIGTHFKEYLSLLLSGLHDATHSKDQQLLIHYSVFFYGNLVDNVYAKDTSLQDFSIKVLKFLKKFKYQRLLQFLYKKSERFLSKEKLNKIISEEVPHIQKSARHQSTSQAQSLTASSSSYKSLAPSNLSPGLYSGFHEMKQFLWFTKLMKDFQFESNEKILNNYIANFCVGNDSNGNPKDKNSYLIATEFLSAVFNGIARSITYKSHSYILFNWKNFIVSRVPIILSSLKFSSEKPLEAAIETAIQSLPEKIVNSIKSIQIGTSKQYDLSQKFVKACIFNKVLSPSSYQKLFPVDFKNIQQSLQQEYQKFNQDLKLQHSFNEKLLNVNTEFTSLEESGLVDFISTLPSLLEYSYERQLELSKIVDSILDDLINYQHQEKLNRLLLSGLSNVQFINLIAFNSHPKTILTKLIDYADKDCFKLEDDDDERFQEIYSYFGVLLLGITLLVEVFKVDFSKLNARNSFSIGYLNGFYYNLCANLTNSQSGGDGLSNLDDLGNASNDDSIVISNFNNLMSDWINALFDESNDGLSDDLIKSINIKQIYKLIPLVYQQSVIATKSKAIDFQILSNGLDYLSQVFLVPCTLSIINWLLSKISIHKSINDNLYLEVLHSIIKSNFGGEISDDVEILDGEEEEKRISQEIPLIIFRIVINISGSNMLIAIKNLKDWQSSNLAKQVIHMVKKLTDSNYTEEYIGVKHDFDLDSGISKYLSSFCKPESTDDASESEINDFTFMYHFISENENHKYLLEYLVDEALAYQKTGSDQSRLLLTLGSFIVVLNSVDSAEDKKYWRKLISVRQQSLQDRKFEGKRGIEQNGFILSIDHHYASIFNDSEPSDDLDLQIKGVDDGMLDDDDLFNENPISITNSTKKSTSQVLGSIRTGVHKHNASLAYFENLRAKENDDIALSKTFKILSESFLEEINSLYV